MRNHRSADCLSIALTVVALLLLFPVTVRAAQEYSIPLAFEDRVYFQTAIEQVYWNHRIWPAQNKAPKPPLEAVLPEASIRAKVEDYLQKSNALRIHWQQFVTVQQLQAEMDRIARETRKPDVLRELFVALNNDPYLIAECLARPIVADRLIHKVYAGDESKFEKWWSNVRSQIRAEVAAPSSAYMLPNVRPDGPANADDTWSPTATMNAPTGRSIHTAVWTGAEMIVWGGYDAVTPFLNTGGRYNPATNTWAAGGTSTTNAPGGRQNHTAVWTGTEMIVWGGWDFNQLNTGGRYNPATDTWAPGGTSTTNAPSVRSFHVAVWTGTEMIVWGGYDGVTAYLDTGGRYNPSSDTWVAGGTSMINAPSGRYLHVAVWTGAEMIVWGGWDGTNLVDTGGRYNPATDTWVAGGTNTTNVPSVRYEETAVWTGAEMIIWGGRDGVNYFNTGGQYNPATDSWLNTSTTNAPVARSSHVAVWSGHQMVVWSGSDGVNLPNTGGRYNPATNSWNVGGTSTINAPTGRVSHTAVWTGIDMIVWGGFNGNNLNTGGVYGVSGCSAINIEPALLPDGVLGKVYSQTLSASGGTAPYTYAVSNGSLPDGLTLDPSTGVISGTPTVAAIFSFQITATDSQLCTGSANYSITVTTCLFCDDFEDGVLASNWTYVKQNWVESGGSLQGTPTGRKAIAVAAPAFAGCSVCAAETMMRNVGGEFSLVSMYIWYVDKKNTFELVMKERSDRWVLKQRAGGSIVGKAKSASPIDPNVDYVIQVSYDGTDVKVNINGLLAITYQPVGTVPVATIGYSVKNTTGSFSYIQVN